MRSYLVAVVDGAHARFFTLAAAEFSDQGQSGPHLTEHSGLNNADKPIATKGASNNLIGRKHHGNRHEKTTQDTEITRRFANKVVQHIGAVVQNTASQHLILVAEPHILGNLRESVPNHVPSAMTTSELAKDLCRLNAHELHKYLISKQMLPSPKRSVK
ncbi:host attachment protein [Leptolyngbya sp. Heron Island J]|uniref:host attachment protein n=1 Tax=Leptolyngbya sp. Heron Island J TaxID=1385935 RepID=UPI0003B9441B|nr:host attachment protein [Leptolyngbya sp. Heron Island J]ESA33193.1 host attachment protein [Leptolyngbya sp. Heron Island J]